MWEWSRRIASGASGPVDLGTEGGRAFLQERLMLLADLAAQGLYLGLWRRVSEARRPGQHILEEALP
jgi:hypothetical protein